MTESRERMEAALEEARAAHKDKRAWKLGPSTQEYLLARIAEREAALAASVAEPDGTHVGLTGKMLAYAYDVTRSDELGDWDDMAAFLNKQRAVVEPPPSIALDDLQQIARAAATNAQGDSISIALNEQIVEELTPWMKELLARAVAEKAPQEEK